MPMKWKVLNKKILKWKVLNKRILTYFMFTKWKKFD